MASDPIQTRRDEITHWLNEIRAAKKREEDYRHDGQRILDIYAGGHKDEGRPGEPQSGNVPFNILFSNTETMHPALYSQTPRPVVERRFKDADPLGKLAAKAGERMLVFLLDTNVEGYETFHDGMNTAVLDAVLPGRAVTTVKYDAEFAPLVTESVDDDEPAGEDVDQKQEPMEYAKGELVCLDARSWNKVYFGYAKKWSKVPWIAYEEQIDKTEAERLFDKETAEKLTYSEEAIDDNDEKKERTDATKQGDRKTTTIYQIWDKAGGRQIRYLSTQYQDDYLKVESDPLGLTGFYNCPRPLQFLQKPNDLTPTPLYRIYENQAKELNKIQRRINHIVDAMKARGLYDGQLGSDVEKVFQSDENALVPAENGASLVAQGGIEKSIWFMPLDTLQQVLQQLYAARESCKQVIYEITGISDIIRGASKASETLGAQQIKNQWGTLRLKRLQKEVQRYARDLMRMMLEVAATKFSEETWAKMTGLPFVTTQQHMQAQAIAQASQITGQPLDQQTQMTLQAPVWGQVLSILKDDMQRAYRIDIETNSTVEPEAAEDQEQLQKLMGAIGQTLNGLSPLIAKGILPFEVAQSVLLMIVKRYRFGSEVEDIIRQMKPPPPPDDGGAEKAKAEAQAMQQEIQVKAKEADMGLKMKEMQAQQGLMQKENDLAMREMELQMREEKLRMQEQVATEKLALKEHKFQTTVSATDKVRSIKDQGVKREQQVAQQADTKLADGVSALQDTVSKMAQMQTQLVQTVVQQSEAQQQRIEQVIAAVTAPRVKKAKRGKDGRIEAVEETVA